MPSQEDFDRVHRKVAGDVAGELGWSAIGVMPDGDGSYPFTYTVGLTETRDHAELIVWGLNPGLAHGVLGCAIELIDAGAALADGDRYEGVLAGYDVLVRDVADPESRPLNLARGYNGGRPVKAVQILWPDSQGRFPGEPGCEESCEASQAQTTD